MRIVDKSIALGLTGAGYIAGTTDVDAVGFADIRVIVLTFLNAATNIRHRYHLLLALVSANEHKI